MDRKVTFIQCLPSVFSLVTIHTTCTLKFRAEIEGFTLESYLKGEGRSLGVEAGEGGAGRVTLEEARAQPLGVAFGDEAALVRRDGQNLARLEGLQLGRRAGGAIDLQLVAALVDGVQRH